MTYWFTLNIGFRKAYKSGVTKSMKRNISGECEMQAKTVALVAVMAALANVMSLPPLAIPIPIGAFTSSIHFFQLAIFIVAILAGPWAGLLTGAAGSIYMGATRIPFIVGGIALLGACTGLFAKRFRPVTACLLAWLVQLPYVFVTDYVWFTFFLDNPAATALAIIAPIMLSLGVEALVCAVLADAIVHYLKKAGITPISSTRESNPSGGAT
jgi:uncharacterized membrane protein